MYLRCPTRMAKSTIIRLKNKHRSKKTEATVTHPEKKVYKCRTTDQAKSYMIILKKISDPNLIIIHISIKSLPPPIHVRPKVT